MAAKLLGIRQRNAHRKRRKNKKFIIIFLIACLLVFVRLAGPAAFPAMAGVPQEMGLFPFLPDQNTILKKILGCVIPGLGELAAGGSQREAELREGGSTLVPGRLDPRDPKRILTTQLPYLGEIALQPEPQAASRVSALELQEPRIIVPEQLHQNYGKVIIYHTHTTESFVPTSGKKFTEDLDLTVAKLGSELAALLSHEFNIPVVHNIDIHDVPRSTSYEVALATVRGLLADHPDTAILIDLHRDGVDRNISTVRIDDRVLGRILFVVGSRHPGWRQNLEKALFLHEALEEMAPGLSRGVRERPLVYNQHLHPGALLIEIGGHENSLEEAMASVPYLARVLAKLYYR